MTYGQDDVATMLEDLGEDVTIGGVTAKGIYRRAGELVLDQGSSGTIVPFTHVVVQRGAFPALAIGVAVRVDNADWIARAPLDLPDPRFVRVELRVA